MLLAGAMIAPGAPAWGTRAPDPGSALTGEPRNPRHDGLVPVIILLRDQAQPFDLGGLRQLGRDARRLEVNRRLASVAERSQRGVLEALHRGAARGEVSAVRPLWLVNAVAAHVSPAMIDALAGVDGVERVLPDRPVESAGWGVSPGEGPVGAGRATACGLQSIHAPDAWDAGYTGEGVIVGVIDTGLCLTHPDIAGQLWTNAGEIPSNGIDDDGNGFTDDIHGWNFENDSANLADSQGHGSHVAGVVAGDGTQGMRCGAAPDASVMTLKFWNNLGGESSVWLAMQYGLENGADVLNGSLGWRHAFGPHRAVWRAVCENAFAAGVVVVFSAGSEGSAYGIDSVHTPGDVPDMITVGATDCELNIAHFSSRGPVSWQDVDPYNDWPYPPGKLKPTLVAPGINTLSHNLCDGYVYYSGVAMAVPHVAGTAAMMLQANPALDHYQIKEILKATAIDRGDAGPDNAYGAGFLDAWGAVRAARDGACPADFNRDGAVNTLDVLAFLNAWSAGDIRADVNGDGRVDTLDVLAFLNLWNAGC